ncbi:conserved hypothetical protein [Candidatus Sulfopaludibacter sp. SbA3]|nr:conserved hypothetical protein [Candidatus Sulfopaludibacter sp. SbA3]
MEPTPIKPSNQAAGQAAAARKAARERKQERFTTLLHHLTVNLLRDSYYALKRKAAPGVDGIRWVEYEDGLEPRLRDLHERVIRRSIADLSPAKGRSGPGMEPPGLQYYIP